MYCTSDLTIIYKQRRLFWINSGASPPTIGTSIYNGSSAFLLPLETVDPPLNPQVIYADSTMQRVFIVSRVSSRINGSAVTIGRLYDVDVSALTSASTAANTRPLRLRLVRDGEGLADTQLIKLYNTSKSGSTACRNGTARANCSHLCAPTGRSTYKCLCADNYVLIDEHRCIRTHSSYSVVYTVQY